MKKKNIIRKLEKQIKILNKINIISPFVLVLSAILYLISRKLFIPSIICFCVSIILNWITIILTVQISNTNKIQNLPDKEKERVEKIVFQNILMSSLLFLGSVLIAICIVIFVW